MRPLCDCWCNIKAIHHRYELCCRENNTKPLPWLRLMLEMKQFHSDNMILRSADTDTEIQYIWLVQFKTFNCRFKVKFKNLKF